LEYVRLGCTGTMVSRICLGCMTFGEPDRGRHPWTMGAEQSRPIIRRALEAGINFFHTAPIVGASKLAHVDDAVAALKLNLPLEETALLEAPYVPHAVAGQ
jgi:aryl-alcohol dehydrogenase-like predicted oxidoreductase